MMAGQLSRCDPVSNRYWQGYKASRLDLMFKVIRCRELANAFLIEIFQALTADTTTRFSGSAIASRA
jgi:hypothetical protein